MKSPNWQRFLGVINALHATLNGSFSPKEMFGAAGMRGIADIAFKFVAYMQNCANKLLGKKLLQIHVLALSHSQERLPQITGKRRCEGCSYRMSRNQKHPKIIQRLFLRRIVLRYARLIMWDKYDRKSWETIKFLAGRMNLSSSNQSLLLIIRDKAISLFATESAFVFSDHPVRCRCVTISLTMLGLQKRKARCWTCSKEAHRNDNRRDAVGMHAYKRETCFVCYRMVHRLH